jgi:fluoroacetyl-CoA thioesterase
VTDVSVIYWNYSFHPFHLCLKNTLQKKESPMTELIPGLSAEISITVTESDTAANLGSGLVPVYATPALVALMEAAAVKALDGFLPEHQTTVGTRIDVRHLAATPIGMTVRARAELTVVDGRKLTFKIEAWDDAEKIGEAQHERFVIETQKFMARTQAKKPQGNQSFNN